MGSFKVATPHPTAAGSQSINKDGGVAGDGAAQSSSAAVKRARGAAKKTDEPNREAWWVSFAMFMMSGVSWVMSIPILLLTLGGSVQPFLGWPCGLIAALLLFSVLVQVDQRIAAFVVFVVTFSAAAAAGGPVQFLFATVASGMVLLNGIRRVCAPSPALLDLQCRYYKNYHARSELRGALDTIQPGHSFFACHPHGMLSVGWVSNVIWNRRFHEAAGRCFYLIDGTLRNKGLLARILCDAFEGLHGGFRDNSKETMQMLLERGESVCMIPGAHQEATLCRRGRERVAIAKRRGFVKYCLRHGYRLHPVYTFNESETYNTVGGFENLRLWLNNWGIPTVAFWGLWWCPLLPRTGVSLLTFVGPPLVLPRIAEPSDEDVGEWHAKYVEALRELFDRHKAEAGKPGARLEVL